MSLREFEHVFLTGRQFHNRRLDEAKHCTARWKSLTEGQEDHFDLKSEVGD